MTCSLANDQLAIHRQRHGSSSLTPMVADVFTDAWVGQIFHSPAKPWALAFDRGDARKVSGFRVSDSGDTMRNLKFFKQDRE